MGKSWLRLSHSTLRSRIDRFIVFAFIILFCCYGGKLSAAVNITAAVSGSSICSNKAATGASPAFTTLGPITIQETINSDFNGGPSVTDVIVLNAPFGWQFSGAMPTFSFITGSNVTAVTGSITSSTLTINITVNNTTGADQVTINGLQVQANTTSSPTGNIYASSVSGVVGITTGSGGTNFGTLGQVTAVTPSVSITSSSPGAICPGTSVTFTPVPVNGGAAPAFLWSLNGSGVSIGPSYTNSGLANGNTISCTMTSSGGCLTTNGVTSNIITMAVNPAPAPITGSTSICPGITTTLSDATSSGTWSSSNTAVATVAAGVVTGNTTGTTSISYMAGGCAAIATIYVNGPPMTPVLSPTVTSICNGTSIAINAAGTVAPGTILSQNFNGGIAPWTVDNTGSIGTLPGSEWKTCGDGYVNEQGLYHSPDNSTFVMSNSDTSGSSSYTSSKLISPSFSLVGYAAATLSFQHSYDYWPSGDINVNLEVSTNGGTTWTPVVNYAGATIGAKTSFATQTYSLNAYLGNPNVMIRFYYYCHWGYYWAIDNVSVTGVPSLVAPTWSPITHLYSDPAFSTPYVAGTPLSTVYVHPTTVLSPASVTYVATASLGGCSATATSTVNINPSPGITTGNLNICVGTTTTLSNTAAGGTWLSGNIAVATVVAGTGAITGVSIGTATMSYILGTSCVVLSTVTVSTTPAAITGPSNLCLGNSTLLTDATTGGSWTSSNTAVATINAATGLAYGASLGTANITYSLGAGCTAVKAVTVSALPAAITGTALVCAGQTTTLANVTSGGTWTSANATIATVAAASGLVTGVAGGITDVTYTVTATGCSTTVPVTVNPMAPIAGTLSICAGLSAMLSDAATGGTWSSNNTPVATIDVNTGLVTAIAAGTTTISYIIAATGCAAAAVVSVNPLPAPITGTTNICVSSSATLADATTGGTWSSSNTSVATVGNTTGIVTGIVAGTSVITYMLNTGCIKTTTVVINPLPAAITGTATVCEGLTTALTSVTTGGTWSSSNTILATVGTSGIVTGILAGNVNITYTLPTACLVIRPLTVNPLPAPITGANNVCQGLTTALADATSGGTWASSNSAVANVGPGGLVFGGIASTAIITYTLPTSCFTTYPVTVNTLPANILGPLTVCTGAATTLTDASSGGTWSSSNSAYATVTGAGVVTGIIAGNVNITYTLPTTCMRTVVVTVNPVPAPITGNTAVCVGSSTTLNNSTYGGTWSCNNTAIASIGITTGVLTGITQGTAVITYTLSTGCYATFFITVNPLPPAITGSTNVCLGLTSAMTDAATGGTWASNNPLIAGIDVSSGLVTGGAAGTAIITYTLSTGCIASVMITVNPLPSPLTGPTSVCVGLNALLSSLSGGGIWSSSNNALATVASGIVTGIDAGTAFISYTLPTGCFAVRPITVNPIPAVITGPLNICQGASATLSNSTTGGTWISNTTTVATIGAASGIINGIAGGVTSITYLLGNGCLASVPVTVTALPSVITGANNLCQGNTILLSDATTGGSWSSSNSAIAAINAVGVVSGVAPGTATITYSLPLGCYVTRLVSVNPLPVAITGPLSVCVGITATLSNATGSGSWSSLNPSVAGISAATGVLIGYIPGTATISYTLSTGCASAAIVTVNMMPSLISGSSGVCVGYTTTLSNTVSGGSWTSSNTAAATVNPATGVVTGIDPGTATITYTLSSGCYVVKTMSVNSLPQPISGIPAICQGLSATFTCPTPGGTWSSSSFTASIAPSTGYMTGIAPGTATISYTLSTGCYATTLTTIYALPAPIGGSGNACTGFTSLLTTTTPGGTWTSSNTSVATIDPVTALVTGIIPGTTVITYAIGVGCTVSRTITVYSLPPAITGSLSACAGLSATLSNPSSGGVWTSSSPAIANVNVASGVVSAFASGTTVITYTATTSCYTTSIFTVSAVAPITGNSNICVGSVSMLSHSVSGGTWSSSNTAVANVNTTGIAVGYSANTATITYTLPGGCIALLPVTVNPLPAAITGPASVCPGFSVTLSNTATGGTWTSANTTIAIVGSNTGVVTGIISGVLLSIVNILYTLPGGCSASRSFTVNPLPAAITGPASVCVGMPATYSSATTGGTWSSSAASIASVVPSTGLVSGIAPGTAVLTYTPPTGCIATTTISVNGLPGPVTGVTTFCSGGTYTLSDATPGGAWTSTNTAAATINATSGLLTAIAAGSATISYTLGAGCAATATVSVSTAPAAIIGISSVCQGYITSLSSSPPGGVWSSNNTAVATVVSGSGMVTGVAPGIANIAYTLPSGCSVTRTVTVSAPPSVITGTTNTCVGSISLLSDPAASGGTWSSNNTAIATIGAATGIVNGIAAGTAVITYTIGTGCSAVTVFTVNALPAPITGTFNACVGMTTTLSSATSGGTWSGDNALVATVVPGTGLVSGIATGTTIISYILPTGCMLTKMLTVNALPSAISGTTAICQGATTILANTTSGGSWSSTNAAIASVSASGIVTAVASGSAVISYILGAGCFSTSAITIYALPGPITGAAGICMGSTAMLSNTAPGGIWSSSNTAVATIAASGLVSALTAGTTTISYTTGMGCMATREITVNPLAPIVGNTNLCVGFTTALTNANSGGIWTSANTAVATVNAASGIVSGVSPGTSLVTYTLATGCAATATVSVVPLTPVTGPTSVCAGSTILLTNASSSGTWTSTNSAIATVNPVTGAVTGIAGGIATISYTFGTGCVAAFVITVHPVAPITGGSSVCNGYSITLANTLPAGTWSTSSSAIAGIGASTGIVTGNAAGTAIITYTLPSACFTTTVVTVNPLAAITGPHELCAGSTTTLSNTSFGGTWSISPSAAAIAAIGLGSGVLTGLSSGTATVSYILGTGCTTATIITVNPLPAPITGASAICSGLSSTLSDITSGGTWASSDAAIAAIGSVTGLLTAAGPGTAVITYTLPTACYTTRAFTVHALPSAITGLLQVCQGSATTLANVTSGGTWASSTPAIAAISAATGTVTGMSPGTTTIVYTLATGCTASALITVNSLPPAITGSTAVCIGQSTTLSNAVAGGSWLSSNPSVAAVAAATGIVTGFGIGTAIITYTLPVGCATTVTVTVLPLPDAIVGSLVVCSGSTTTLTSATTGGLWLSGNTAVATINSTTGLLSGITPGTATISYIAPTGCMLGTIITVGSLPAPVVGVTHVCEGAATSFTNTTPGGSWSSSSTGIATVYPSGIALGLAAGTSSIAYTLPNGCFTSVILTVNPLPGAITGTPVICANATTTLGNSIAGGSWVSSNTAVATIGVATGVLSPVAPGTASITYTLPTGCLTSRFITINPVPAAITGALSACEGAGSVLTSTTIGGTWSSSATAVAGIGLGTGIVSGITAGVTAIYYTMPTGCSASALFTVNPMPSLISGGANACMGTTTLFANAYTGGIWLSSNPAVLSIDPATGLAAGLTLGTSLVTYTLPTGCSRVLPVTVYPVPSAISGSASVCQGHIAYLSDAAPGGLWSSGNPAIAAVGSATGIVTAVTSGTVTVFYTFPTGCSASAVITVNPLQATTGPSTVCTADTVHLHNTVPGGVWSSSTASVATVTSSGVVTAIASGVAVISYTLSTGCIANFSLTVQPLPVAFVVTGGGSFCVGNPGVHVGLNSSVTGFTYRLYNGALFVSALSGTGAALDFGPQTAPGTYTVIAENSATGCSRAMFSSAMVSPVTFGPAGVGISSIWGDTVCAATPVSLTALPYLGGSTPSFQWFVNGAVASAAATFTYTPADGDVITCRMHSNASCATPDTASVTRHMTVLPNVTPSVAIAAAPGATVCPSSLVTYTPAASFGGSYPRYRWLVNGTLADTGATYAYTPANGDNLSCIMTSNQRCANPDTALSNTITMSVAPYTIPTVTINAVPGFEFVPGAAATFTAIVANAGAAPAYQWHINSTAIAGATNSSFTHDSFNDNDTISCLVTADAICAGTGIDQHLIKVYSTGVPDLAAVPAGLKIFPNPNTGSFLIKGLVTGGGDQLNIQVTNVLGQVIYTRVMAIYNGRVEQMITLPAHIADGIYQLRLGAGAYLQTVQLLIKR